MTVPERIFAWVNSPNGETVVSRSDQLYPADAVEFIRADASPRTVSTMPGALALVAGALSSMEAPFMDAVWDALKADANDLRRQQRILRSFRALTHADALAALEALIAEARKDERAAIQTEVQKLRREAGGRADGVRFQALDDVRQLIRARDETVIRERSQP